MRRKVEAQNVCVYLTSLYHQMRIEITSTYDTKICATSHVKRILLMNELKGIII
jgi:hypothetical protein